MAILRSADGKFYDVPDEDLAGYEIPADQVKGMLGAVDPGMGGGQMGGEVQPYAHCGFRNCGFRKFRNCGFRNCGFRNHFCGTQQ